MKISESSDGNVQKLTLCGECSSYKEKINVLKNNIKSTNKRVRENSKWLIVNFYEDVDLEKDILNVERSIKDVFGDILYFIPCYKEQINGEVSAFILFDGYFFIESVSRIINSDLVVSIESIYFKEIMKRNRKLVEVSGCEINNIKKKLWLKFVERFPKKGQIVVPKIGVFSDLEGEVVSVDKRNFVAMVRFKYSAREIEVPISFLNMEIIK